MAEEVEVKETQEVKPQEQKKRVFKPHNKPKKRVCVFCDDKNLKFIDYKDVNRLRKFVTEKGKILPSRHTRTCARHQRELTVAIKRARNMALLPFSGD